MFCPDKEYLDYKIKSSRTTQEAVAKACGCDRSTLRRHFANGDVTLNEMYAIIDFLNLCDEDIQRIFFANKGAKMHRH